jgi:hypothetical protein
MRISTKDAQAKKVWNPEKKKWESFEKLMQLSCLKPNLD